MPDTNETDWTDWLVSFVHLLFLLVPAALFIGLLYLSTLYDRIF